MNTDPAQSEHRSHRAAKPWMMALTLVMIAALLAGFWSYSEHLIGTLERQAERIAVLQTRVELTENILRVVATGASVPLINPGRFPEATAAVSVDTESEHAALVITGFQIPADRQVHLWILDGESIVSGQPVPTTGTTAVFGFAAANGIRSLRRGTLLLTLEHDGAAEQPSPDILARGTLP